jgi:hypothetical protein
MVFSTFGCLFVMNIQFKISACFYCIKSVVLQESCSGSCEKILRISEQSLELVSISKMQAETLN